MTAFEFEAMRSRNRIQAGVPFLAQVNGDFVDLLARDDTAPRPEDRARRRLNLDRFADEGNDPYEDNPEVEETNE